MVAHLYGLLRPGIEALPASDWVQYREFADEWIELQRAQVDALQALLRGGGQDGI